MPMLTLRLLADDLTGALDTAAEAVPLTGPLPVHWPGALPAAVSGSAAMDSGTREQSRPHAIAAVRALVPALAGGSLAFKKIDTLFRGHTMAELAACLQAGPWRSCLLAPAFPHQRRVTRSGSQYAFLNGAWEKVAADLAGQARTLGLPAHSASPDRPLQPGVNVFDAETDADLRAVAACGRRHAEPLLWVGAGGLMQALAAGHPLPPPAPLPRPVLGLFGSDHPATADQLAACSEHRLVLQSGQHAAVSGHLAETGLTLVSFGLDAGLARDQAAQAIAAHITGLTAAVGAPGTAIVAGGETLRALCDALGADSLLVTGRLQPGVPRSILQGGNWNGVTIVSKSGAFGPPDLLRRLLLDEGTPA